MQCRPKKLELSFVSDLRRSELRTLKDSPNMFSLLGPPVVPFLTPFLVGRVPLLNSLILTSRLEDLVLLPLRMLGPQVSRAIQRRS